MEFSLLPLSFSKFTKYIETFWLSFYSIIFVEP